jgi:hypothetical protein
MKKIKYIVFCFAALLIIALLSTDVQAQDDVELTKKLSNPISSLISVPFVMEYNENIGVGDEGSAWKLNIQPVVPFTLNKDWNLISRTILPVINQDDIPTKGAGESGIGDIVQSLFFSPAAPTSSGLIWGVGPVFLLPTATDKMLGSEKWGIGPTAVFLKQDGPWTYGALLNHIESFAGDDNRSDISATLTQPFLVYNAKTMTSISLELQSTYDWKNEAWSIPVNLTLSQLLLVGKLPIQVGAGVRYWAASPDSGPEGFGATLKLTFLFPKGR